MESARGKGKEGGASRRRRLRASSGTDVIGDDTYGLHCPLCRAFKTVIVPTYADRRELWDIKPMLQCDGCGELIAATRWHVWLTEFRPLQPVG